MAFLWDQRQRLLREENWGAHALAQELFSMFSPEVPNNTQAPVQVTLPNASTEAPYQVGNYEDSKPIATLSKKDGSPFGTVAIVDGKLTFTDSAGKSNSGNEPSGPTSFPGKVVSGTGATYQVTIYPNGIDGSSKTVSVTQLQINSSETIPADTWAIVTKNGTAYSMVVPVWL